MRIQLCSCFVDSANNCEEPLGETRVGGGIGLHMSHNHFVTQCSACQALWRHVNSYVSTAGNNICRITHDVLLCERQEVMACACSRESCAGSENMWTEKIFVEEDPNNMGEAEIDESLQDNVL